MTQKAYKLEGLSLDIAKRIRETVMTSDAKAEAIRSEANEALQALQIETQMRLRSEWEALSSALGVSEEDLRQYWMDYSYAEDFGMIFLKRIPPPEAPDGDQPAQDFFNLPPSGTIQ